MRRYLMIAAILAVPLSGCEQVRAVLPSTPAPVVVTAPAVPLPPAARTPIVAKSVAAAQIALTNLERVALRYTSLPRCTVPVTVPVCSDPATVEQIKHYDNVAFDAVMRARRNGALLDMAVGAINMFQRVIP